MAGDHRLFAEECGRPTAEPLAAGSGMSHPAPPSASGVPLTAVAITGSAFAIASSTTSGMPS
jgi:hypothetical protein